MQLSRPVLKREGGLPGTGTGSPRSHSDQRIISKWNSRDQYVMTGSGAISKNAWNGISAFLYARDVPGTANNRTV